MSPSPENVIVGRTLKTLRRRAQLPQHRIATALSWPQSQICKIELGIRDLTVPELIRIARLLNVRTAEMIECIEAELDLKKLRPLQVKRAPVRRFGGRTD